MSPAVSILGTRGYPSYYGGFETLVRQLAPFLANRGWDVTVYGRIGSTKEEDSSRDMRVKTVTTWGIESQSISTLSYGLTSSIHTASSKPDVALIMNVANGFFLPILKSRRIPTVVNVDGIEWERAKWGNRAKSVFKAGARATASYADRLVFDSLEIQRRWRADFAKDGVFIPYGGTDPGRLPVPSGLTSRRYGLMVARFVPENTVGEFFEAAERISRTHDVVIVGSSGYGGAWDDQVRALASKNDRVRWLGHISDDRELFALWQHAGAYFHGHSVGGTNPALVQAMACGTPIVARDTVYNREVLSDTAVFVNPDVNQIADAMLDLLNAKDRQIVLGEATKKRGAEQYSWAGVCEKYEHALYEQIDCAKTPGGSGVGR